jgi:glycosyltransferase involved in cell wall biosynthesis
VVLLGQPHRPQGLAVALGHRVAEVAGDLLPRVPPLVLGHDGHPVRADPPKPAPGGSMNPTGAPIPPAVVPSPTRPYNPTAGGSGGMLPSPRPALGFNPKKEDYFLYMGRVYNGKGVNVAIQATEKAGVKLIIAGQKEEGYHLPDHVEYIGYADVPTRKKTTPVALAATLPVMAIIPCAPAEN